MVKEYVGHPLRAVDTVREVVGRSANDAFQSGDVPTTANLRSAGQATVCESVLCTLQSHGFEHGSLEAVREILGGAGGSRPDPASEGYDQAAGPALGGEDLEQVQGQRERSSDYHKSSVESGGPVDGDRRNHAGDVPGADTNTDRGSMGAKTQKRAPEAVLKINVHGNPGGLDGRDLRLHQDFKGESTADDMDDKKNFPGYANAVRSGLQQPLHQARLSDVPHEARSTGNHHSRGGGQTRQACKRRDDSTLCGRSGGNGTRIGHATGDGASLNIANEFVTLASIENAEDEKVLYHQLVRHTITRMRHPTRIATPEDVERLSINIDTVPVANIHRAGGLVEMMNEHTAKRFNETWEKFCRLPPPGTPVQFSFTPCPDKVSDMAGRCGIAEPVTAEMERLHPTLEAIIPFLVVEERDGEERLRWICWTRLDNERLRKDYEPDVPIKHVSYYLSAVHEVCGGKRDVRCGFYHIETPVESRAKHRFRDVSGRLWQMTRASMGNRVVPELMHTMTGTLAGHPDFCSEDYIIPVKQCDIYIDGIRAADTTVKLELYFQQVDERAIAVNVLFKASDSYIGPKYTFDGVNFDHNTHKVAVGDKLRTKIRDADLSQLTLGKLESLVARLNHASAIVCPQLIPTFYMVIKYTRRRTSLMNRGVSPETTCTLPKGVRLLLRLWINATTADEVWVKPPPDTTKVRASFVMFTDAARGGWGAFLVCLLTGRLFVAGSRWPKKHVYEINKDEVQAVALATAAFSRHFQPGIVVDLRVDNTSAESSTNRGRSLSFGVSKELSAFLLTKTALEIGMRASHVPTKLNISDPVSRGVYDSVWKRKGKSSEWVRRGGSLLSLSTKC